MVIWKLRFTQWAFSILRQFKNLRMLNIPQFLLRILLDCASLLFFSNCITNKHVCSFIFYLCITVVVCLCMMNMYDTNVCGHMPLYLRGDQNIIFWRQGHSYMVCDMNYMLTGLRVLDNYSFSTCYLSIVNISVKLCIQLFTCAWGSNAGSQVCSKSNFTHFGVTIFYFNVGQYLTL